MINKIRVTKIISYNIMQNIIGIILLYYYYIGCTYNFDKLS